jgi:hypothetical protein
MTPCTDLLRTNSAFVAADSEPLDQRPDAPEVAVAASTGSLAKA